MQLHSFRKGTKLRSVAINKKTLIMRLALILLFAIPLQTSARNTLQEITLSLTDAKLETVFKEIQKQTSYRFVYTKEQMEMARKVSLEVKKEKLETVLLLCFKRQPLSYFIEDNVIIVSEKEKALEPASQFIDIIGKVINEQGQVLPGASVAVKETNRGTATDGNGEFTLKGIEPDAILIISNVGYESQAIRIQGQSVITVQLKMSATSLDETVVIAYGTTTKRLNTGNVGKITSAEISKQPVSNPLAVLEGRVPGLVVVQSNGVPGSAFKILIRGKNSLAQGSDPLFIIDGVPFAPNNNSINLISAAFSANGGGLSPFNTINPESIESIEVLKDADATAIYGSRGANGVILITTKKGKAGKSKFTVNVYHGNSKVARTMDYLNTQEYLQMRHEAFTMDGITPNNNNAYDFLLWDTTRYTDFKKLLIGNTAHTTDAQISVSGGNANTQFLLGGGYHNETTVFPGDFSDEKASFNLNLNHITNDKKFTVNLSTIYSYDNNNISTSDLGGLLLSSIPNLPSLYDSNGKLNWIDKGFYFINPLASTYQKYSANVKNLIGNLQISYKLTPDIHLIASAGYNDIQTSETRLSPKMAQLPVGNVTGSALFGNSSLQNWLVEPQIKYNKQISKGKLQVLIGSTFQENINDGTIINATGYTSDLLLQTPNAAGATKVTNNYSKYRYSAFFARINYNWQDKYILNMSGRRDGSSRFGPESQFANFAAVGAGWIFSKEAFIAKNFHFLSFGKLRGSYGSSGNDQIGDYKYLDTWQSTTYTYQSSGLTPSSLFNPEYGWELNKKIEIGLELGFLKDHISLSASYFRNRCNNQLISYRLPSQTGFASILKNFPALIQNTGLEFEISSSIVKSRNFSWTSSLNITIPKNKLLEFENLSNSSYSNLVIGEPLSVYGGFHFTGVDPATGIYQFADKAGNNTSSPSSTNDWINNLGNLEPKFYGGFNNNFSYKRFSLDVFASFKKQKGPNYLYALSRTVPGTINNQPIMVMERWQKPGAMTTVQRFTQQPSNAAYAAARTFYSYTNDGQFGDASYIRIKNISFSYSLAPKILEKLKLENCFFYLRGQNLFTLTNYMGSDPESLNAGALPPLKTFVVGISITF